MSSTSKAPKKRRSRKFLVAYCLGLLLLIEAGCHFLPVGRVPDFLFFRGYSLQDKILQTWQFHKKTMVWPSKNNMVVTMNSLAYRGAEFPRPGNRFRIAGMGDSRTFGLWVNDDQTWCAVLEETLRKEYGQPAECLNFGVQGSTTYEAVQTVIPDVANALPDLVIVGYSGANSSLMGLVTDEQYTSPDDWLRNTLRLSRAYQYGELLYYKAKRAATGAPRVSRVPLPDFIRDWEFLLGEIDDLGAGAIILHQWVRHEDIPEVFDRNLYATYVAALKEISRERRIDFLDVERLFGSRPEEYFVENDVHYNAQGHALIAKNLAALIADHFLKEPAHASQNH